MERVNVRVGDLFVGKADLYRSEPVTLFVVAEYSSSCFTNTWTCWFSERKTFIPMHADLLKKYFIRVNDDDDEEETVV